MTFCYVPRARVQPTSRIISYSVTSPGGRGGKLRHNALLGPDVLAIMGWQSGDRIVVGYGEPGSEHAGWAEFKLDPKGVALRRTNNRSPSAQVQISFYPAWLTGEPHAAEHCSTWNREGAALRVKLPAWAMKTEYTVERKADRPPAECAQTGAPANSSLAQAGGGDGLRAPPAVLPGTGLATVRPVRTGSSMVHGISLTPPQRAIYDLLASAAERGEPTPLLKSLVVALGGGHEARASSVIIALKKKGAIKAEYEGSALIYRIAGTGLATKARRDPKATPDKTDPVRAAVKAPIADPPRGDTQGGVAPFKAGPLPPAANGHDKPKPPASAPPLHVKQGGTVTMKFLVDWLNEMGMTCAPLDGGMYLMGDRYVEAIDVIARANRKRNLRKEPEFVVSP